MKTLLLIRHAKSSWKDPGLTDLQRPLKKRGEKNASEMARRLIERKVSVEKVFSSPANRAIETVSIMQAEGALPQDVDISSELYSFDYGDVLRFVFNVSDDHQHICLAGHNPAITDLVNFLALENIKNIPTCGIALLKFDCKHWQKLKAGSASLVFYDFPKNDFEFDESA
jgi:phosphohistidine phosphatase